MSDPDPQQRQWYKMIEEYEGVSSDSVRVISYSPDPDKLKALALKLYRQLERGYEWRFGKSGEWVQFGNYRSATTLRIRPASENEILE